MPTEVITPYTNIPIAPLEPKSDVRYGSQFFRDVQELQVGIGSKVMRVDQQGLWLGAETFAAAPFSVDMNGNVVATSLSLGTLSGTLDDIADGTVYNKTTVNEALGASYAYGGLNSSGEIIKGFLNSQLSAKSLPANGVRVDSSGIYGRKSSATTFYIDNAGNAYFTGDIASASMSASTITGSTITGTTLSTATSGQRVVLFSTLASYYNSSGTLICSTYASGSSYLIKGEQSGSNIYLDSGSAGTVAFLTNGSLKAIFDGANQRFTPYSNGGIDLGASGANWRNVQHSGAHIYQGMDQPVIYFGLVSSGSIVNDNFVPFSVNNSSTGVYVITHSFGHNDYSVNVIAKASTVKNITISASSSSSFTVRIANLSDVLENNDFFFQVFEYPQ